MKRVEEVNSPFPRLSIWLVDAIRLVVAVGILALTSAILYEATR